MHASMHAHILTPSRTHIPVTPTNTQTLTHTRRTHTDLAGHEAEDVAGVHAQMDLDRLFDGGVDIILHCRLEEGEKRGKTRKIRL